jgi:hypothetical protein
MLRRGELMVFRMGYITNIAYPIICGYPKLTTVIDKMLISPDFNRIVFIGPGKYTHLPDSV